MLTIEQIVEEANEMLPECARIKDSAWIAARVDETILANHIRAMYGDPVTQACDEMRANMARRIMRLEQYVNVLALRSFSEGVTR
jgi:hypothetical protein